MNLLTPSNGQVHGCVDVVFDDLSEVVDLDTTAFILIHQLKQPIDYR